MISRRSFISMAAAFAFGPSLKAQTNPSDCHVLSNGVDICNAEVSIPTLIAAINTQQCPEWCWAACISMIFGFYGHPIDQKEIVRQTYGQVVCLPAGSTKTIGLDLSRTWTDANGDQFKSKVVAAFDPANNIDAMNNTILINELENDHPILYCNRSHAMVIYAADYVPNPMGPVVQAVGVVDPWPYSPRTHLLSPAEMRPVPFGDMTFLATVRHEDVN